MERRRSSRRNSKRTKKSWMQRCKDCLRQFIAFLFSNVGIICLVVGYTVFGAFMFQRVEEEPGKHNETVQKLEKVYDDSVQVLWNAASMELNPPNETAFKLVVERQLLQFQDVIIGQIRDNDYDGQNIYSDRWSISASSLYCLTVITTIGYGNVTPRTTLGKIATVVYAIFGMPLFLLYLSNIGDLLATSFKWLYAKLCLCKICRVRRRRLAAAAAARLAGYDDNTAPVSNSWGKNRNKEDMTEGEESDDEGSSEDSSSSSSSSSKDPEDIVVPITICLAIMIGYISGGALLFSHQESWDFLDGSYFCFISLSTIGFGDIVPTTNRNTIEISFIFCSIYLMLGMALIAMCFNLMQLDVVQKIRTCSDILKRIARCRR